MMSRQTLIAKNTNDARALVGLQGRVGGMGQEYEVVGIVDDTFATIHAKRWDERVPYRIADVRMDAAGITGVSRFNALVGKVRSIGEHGPKYEVLSVDDQGGGEDLDHPERRQ